MSQPDQYTPLRYITVTEALDAVGVTKEQQKSISQADRDQYQSWTKEANTLIESSLFPDSDIIPLDEGSKEFTFAKQAAKQWVIYKKRDLVGSINAGAAKKDFELNIKLAKQYLKRVPTLKDEPIQKADVTDSLEDFIIPYSQTQGYPVDLLY